MYLWLYVTVTLTIIILFVSTFCFIIFNFINLLNLIWFLIYFTLSYLFSSGKTYCFLFKKILVYIYNSNSVLFCSIYVIFKIHFFCFFFIISTLVWINFDSINSFWIIYFTSSFMLLYLSFNLFCSSLFHFISSYLILVYLIFFFSFIYFSNCLYHFLFFYFIFFYFSILWKQIILLFFLFNLIQSDFIQFSNIFF